MIRGYPVAPLTGLLDTRSTPDALAAESLRMRQNFQTTSKGKLRRGTGWVKFLDSPTYNNADFHDQLLTFTPGSVRQPITLLYEADNSQYVRSLIVGTQNKIAKLDQHSGNYRILGSGYGGPASTSASAPRFVCDQVGDYLAFTNNFDKPLYHTLAGSPITPAPLLSTFSDLDIIGVTQAGTLWAWHNCLFLANVFQDSQRKGNLLLWSDFLNPTSFDPAILSSITGTQELFSFETILRGMPLGQSLLIYTSHGIWEMQVVGGDQSFAFVRRYAGEENDGIGLLWYPNTLVALTDTHLYLAQDGFYSYNPWYGKPTRPEWLHAASSIVLDKIDSGNCSVHVGRAGLNEAIFSIAELGAPNQCPNITIRVNIQYQTVDVIDHGFTAVAGWRDSDNETIRDFIVQNGICTLAGLATAGYGYANEGLPNPLPASQAPFTPTCIYTTHGQTIAGKNTEDWNQPTADPHSLCALLGNLSLQNMCVACEPVPKIIACSSTDWCIKQLGGGVFYRETCANPSAVGTTDSVGYHSAIGSYTLDAYDSILRFAPIGAPLGQRGNPMITVKRLLLNAISRIQTPPAKIGLRIGISGQFSDPNFDIGQIVWFQHSLKDLAWLSAGEQVELQRNTIPVTLTQWTFDRRGRVLYIELKISGIGGDCDISSAAAEAELLGVQNF